MKPTKIEFSFDDAKLEAIKKFPHLFEVVGIVPEDEKVAERIKNDAVYGGILPGYSVSH